MENSLFTSSTLAMFNPWVAVFISIYIPLIVLLVNTRLEKIKATREIEHILFDSENLDNGLKQIRSLVKKGRTCTYCENLRQYKKNNENELINTIKEEEEKKIKYTLNMLERMSNGVYHNAYNQDYLFSSIAVITTSYFKNTIPYLLQHQSIENHGYIKFCLLSLDWELKSNKKRSADEYKHLKKSHELLKKYIHMHYENGVLDKINNLIYTCTHNENASDNIFSKYQSSLSSYYGEICNKTEKTNKTHCWRDAEGSFS